MSKDKNEEKKTRVRTPRNNQVLGKVIQMHGGKRMTVECNDGNRRMCRVPGRKSRIWVKRDDYVLVEPWDIQSDEKGDIVWKYRKSAVNQLRKKGYLEGLE